MFDAAAKFLQSCFAQFSNLRFSFALLCFLLVTHIRLSVYLSSDLF